MTGEELRAATEEVGNVTRDFDKAIETYISDVEETASCVNSAIQSNAWQGEANEEFKSSVQAIIKEMKRNSDALAALSAMLKEKAKEYDELIKYLREAGY